MSGSRDDTERMWTFFITSLEGSACSAAMDESADADLPVEERANIGIARLLPLVLSLLLLLLLLLLGLTPHGLPGADTFRYKGLFGMNGVDDDRGCGCEDGGGI